MRPWEARFGPELAPGLSNKAPANSCQSISTPRTKALLLLFFFFFFFLFFCFFFFFCLPFSSHADRPAAVHRKCYGQHQGCRSTSLAAPAPGLSNKAPANSCQSISTARTEALLLRFLLFFFFFFFFFFCLFFFFFFFFFFFCLPFSSHADRPAAVHRKCYGQHQGCRSTSLAGSAPGLSNKAPANSRQSISTARTEAFLLCFLLPVASGFSDLVMLLGLLLTTAAVIAVVGVYPGVGGRGGSP